MHASGNGDHAARVACIVWHAKGKPLSPALRTALDTPRLASFECDNEFAALAACCRESKGHAGRPVLLAVSPSLLHDAGLVVSLLRDRFAPRIQVWVFDETAHPALRAATDAELASWPGADQPGLAPVAMIGAPAIAQNPAATVSALAQPAPAPLPAKTDRVTLAPLPKAPPKATVPPKLRLSGEGNLPPSAEDPVPEIKAAAPRQEPAAGPSDTQTGQDTRPRSTANLLSDEELAMLLAPMTDPKRT